MLVCLIKQMPSVKQTAFGQADARCTIKQKCEVGSQGAVADPNKIKLLIRMKIELAHDQQLS
jgi:hypothetical protein